MKDSLVYLTKSVKWGMIPRNEVFPKFQFDFGPDVSRDILKHLQISQVDIVAWCIIISLDLNRIQTRQAQLQT